MAMDTLAVQKFLNADGASPKLDEDGVAGPMTHDAITHWQLAHGLSGDGVAGPLTQAAMESKGATNNAAVQASKAIAAQQSAGVPVPKPVAAPIPAPKPAPTGPLGVVHNIAPAPLKPAVAAMAEHTQRVTTVVKESPIGLRIAGAVALGIGTIAGIKTLLHKRV